MDAKSQFGIEVNFLTGRFVATAHNDREQAEWPPHPARLFSALTAAYAEREEQDSAERQALDWLASQPPPGISASASVPRRTVQYFVPVNDTYIIGKKWHEINVNKVVNLLSQYTAELQISNGQVTKRLESLESQINATKSVESQVNSVGNTNPEEAQKMLPEHRGKQARHFPSVTPDDPRVVFCWNTLPGPKISKKLDCLLERVTRLGHSSTLVSCRSVTTNSEATYSPGTGSLNLRWVKGGQVDELERRFSHHQGNLPRALPYVNVQYYNHSEKHTQPTVIRPNTAGEWIVFEFLPGSKSFPALRAVEVAAAMRGAIFHFAKNPMPEELSGHVPSGKPTTLPHISFLPLPHVGSEYADGRLLGLAVSIPDTVSITARQALYRAIGNWERATGKEHLKLTFGKEGAINLRRQSEPITLVSLRESVWNRRSSHFVTITPIALPRHPGNLRYGSVNSRSKAWDEAKSSIVLACKHVGLPEPASVEISLAPYIKGVYPVHRFPTFKQKQNGKKQGFKQVSRQLIHASITFKELVKGPVVLGAGRFIGLGLMRPMNERHESHSGRAPKP